MNSTLFTLAQASKITGKDKSTIQRWIKSGRLSARVVDGGRYLIDASELHRVCPFSVEDATNATVATGSNATKRNKLQHHGSPSNADVVIRSDDDATMQNPLHNVAMQRSATPEVIEEMATLRAENRLLREMTDDLRKRLDAESEERRRLTYLLQPPEKMSLEPSQTTVEAQNESDSDDRKGEGENKWRLWRLLGLK